MTVLFNGRRKSYFSNNINIAVNKIYRKMQFQQFVSLSARGKSYYSLIHLDSIFRADSFHIAFGCIFCTYYCSYAFCTLELFLSARTFTQQSSRLKSYVPYFSSFPTRANSTFDPKSTRLDPRNLKHFHSNMNILKYPFAATEAFKILQENQLSKK